MEMEIKTDDAVATATPAVATYSFFAVYQDGGTIEQTGIRTTSWADALAHIDKLLRRPAHPVLGLQVAVAGEPEVLCVTFDD